MNPLPYGTKVKVRAPGSYEDGMTGEVKFPDPHTGLHVVEFQWTVPWCKSFRRDQLIEVKK